MQHPSDYKTGEHPLMKNSKYLSDVLDTSSFVRGKLNVINTPCGSGKTTAAINTIAALASSPRKALYLIDTSSGRDRLEKNEHLTRPYVFFEVYSSYTLFPVPEGEIPDKVVVATYAKFGMWVAENPAFASYFEVIICDEAHNLIEYCRYESNPTRIARDALCQAVRVGKTLVVAMTATPDALEKMRCPQHIVPIDTSELRQYENHNVVHYASIKGLIQNLPLQQIGAIFTIQVKQMIELAALAASCGRKPLCIWSPNSNGHPLSLEQQKARAYILEHEEVPPEYDLLIFNAAYETSINLRGHFDFMIIHHSSSDTIIQARGRYRNDLDTLYLLDKECGMVHVPSAYLNRKLYTQDKKALQAALDIKNDKGNSYPWKHVLPLMESSGYVVHTGRDSSTYMIIQDGPSLGSTNRATAFGTCGAS